jgi:hypothetical protein
LQKSHNSGCLAAITRSGKQKPDMASTVASALR